MRVGLKIKPMLRDIFVNELTKYKKYDLVVHLRGTDRVNQTQRDEYIKKITEKINNIKYDNMLVLSDDTHLINLFKPLYPNAHIKTDEILHLFTFQMSIIIF